MNTHADRPQERWIDVAFAKLIIESRLNFEYVFSVMISTFPQKHITPQILVELNVLLEKTSTFAIKPVENTSLHAKAM